MLYPEFARLFLSRFCPSTGSTPVFRSIHTHTPLPTLQFSLHFKHFYSQIRGAGQLRLITAFMTILVTQNANEIKGAMQRVLARWVQFNKGTKTAIGMRIFQHRYVAAHGISRIA